MKIPFALPLIDNAVIQEVNDCLTNSGWLTSGPKVGLLEKEVVNMTGCQSSVCVNSWTSGAMLMLRWFGIGPDDEVIIPAYTYSATALCILNIGAKVVMVDVGDDFNIDPTKIRLAITPKTKAIIPVDIGGWPCDYSAIYEVLNTPEVKAMFQPANEKQEMLGRMLVITDAAHSIGATYKGNPSGILSDVTVMSFHSVKNVTTGEGGVVCLNLPEPFDPAQEYEFLKAFALNGQTKSAYEKNQVGGWRYDIIAQGLKVNMPDICAAIGLSQIRRYLSDLLPERVKIFERYHRSFAQNDWTILPPFKDENRSSSCHLYQLRIAGINEHQRDQMIEYISQKGVGVNVHYIPMAMLTLFRNMGYDINDYPNTFQLYENEISLPIYNGLTPEQVDKVIGVVEEAYGEVVGSPSVVVC